MFNICLNNVKDIKKCSNNDKDGHRNVSLSSAILFKSTFSLIFFQKYTTISVSLDPVQARKNVQPDLGQNCLLKLTGNTSKIYSITIVYLFQPLKILTIEQRREERSSFTDTRTVRESIEYIVND